MPPWEKFLLWVLVILNSIVLLGQIWPEGAPPFARGVNIAFLTVSFGWFLRAALKKSPVPPRS